MISQSTSRREPECGAFLLILASSIVVVLTLIGFAVDSAKLYRTEIWVQNITDAAAVAGTARYSWIYRNGTTRSLGNAPAQAQSAAESLVTQSLLRHGVQLNSVNANFNPNDFELEVETEVSVPLWFMRLLPGFRGDDTIRASSAARLPRAVINLVLDVSGSMLCPTVGPCDCKPGCPDGSRKIDALVEAAKSFVNNFDPARDKIALTVFSLGARTLVDFIPGPGTGFDLAALTSAIDALDTPTFSNLSATNPTDGLFQASQLDPGLSEGFDRAYVLFTDGAPTAARFFFSNPSALPGNNPTGTGAYDYYSWDLAWAELSAPNTFLFSPSALTRAPSRSVTFPPFVIPGGEWDPYTASSSTNIPPANIPGCTGTNPTDPTAPFRNCLTNFGFFTPDGGSYGSLTPFTQYREQYYHAAIAMSDYLRNNRGVVYAIGLGPEGISGDPYQNVADHDSRKDYFLARLSHDAISSSHPTFSNLYSPSRDQNRGLALGTPSFEDLEDFFNLVARRIKMKLVR